MRRFYGFIGLLLAWELAARAYADPALPPLSAIEPALMRMVFGGAAWPEMLASLRHVSIGFALAAIVGVGLGLLLTRFRWLDAVVMPLVDAMRPVAALTLFPLLIIIFGLGLWSKVFIIFWTAWPAILLNTAQGIYDVDDAVIEAAALDGAGRWAILTRVQLPLAAPTIVTGLRIGMSGGWISLVTAEMLGGSVGLGYAILSYSQTFRYPEMYATIILIALLGLAMNALLYGLQRLLDYRDQTKPLFIPDLAGRPAVAARMFGPRHIRAGTRR
jgi:ABC-type nitrate/sulfonate/bicarbonate transport system permease component